MNEQPMTKQRPEIKGKVVAILPEWRNQSGSFWKQDVVIETGFRFENPIKVTFQKDSTSYLDNLREGDAVSIPYTLNGREYEGKYFVDVIGLGCTRLLARTAEPAAAKPIGATQQTAVETWTKYHGDDVEGFKKFCLELKPGKSSKSYTLADWADVVNAIEEAQKPAPKAEESQSMAMDDLGW